MVMFRVNFILIIIAFLVTGCAGPKICVKEERAGSYTIMGKTYYPLKSVNSGYQQKGVASWYGPGFHGRKTANGEIYNMHEMTAAHNILPLNTVVKVTNLQNNKEAIVRINDRGPFVDDRVIDLSRACAEELGILGPGTAPVKLTVLEPGVTKTLAKRSAPAAVKTAAKGPNPFFNGSSFTLLALIR